MSRRSTASPSVKSKPMLFPFGDVILSPLCVYQQHCGAKAERGDPVDHGGAINCAVWCLTCGARGEQSTRKDRDAEA